VTNNNDDNEINRAIDEEIRFEVWRGLIAQRDPILDEMEREANKEEPNNE